MAKKTTTAQSTAARTPKTPAPKTQNSPQGVRIRMYCQGLGDCFLLTFPGSRKGREVHVLIDCGVILGTEHGNERIAEVVQNIYDELPKDKDKKAKLDLLVGTHEHWDHISGFAHPDRLFDQFSIKQTWLAWTEDLDDKTAQQIRQERDAKKKKLGLAIDHYQQALQNAGGRAPTAMHTRLAGLSSFLGIDMAAAKSEADIGKTAQAMEYLRTRNAKYLKPSAEPIKLSGLDDVEIFVLGPPEGRLLKKSLPTKKGHEVFEEDGQVDVPGHALRELAGVDVPAEDFDRKSQPFAQIHSQPIKDAWSDPFFAQFYDNGLPDHPAAWRRIDDVGMFAATELALQLDAATNNTSLVLAFRLANGRVLLFPGDAQVGNWESWYEKPLNTELTTSLLESTLVYKVGHHGSHNATLSTLGLAKMKSADLMALLPVDEAVAHRKGWVKMPFYPLMTELRKKTAGRILRSDHEVPHPATAPAESFKPDWAPSAETFNTDPKRSLYLEIIV